MKSTLRYIGGPEMPRSKSRAVVKSRDNDGVLEVPDTGRGDARTGQLVIEVGRHPRAEVHADRGVPLGQHLQQHEAHRDQHSGAARPSSPATASTRRPVATANTDGSAARSARALHQISASGRSARGRTAKNRTDPRSPSRCTGQSPPGSGPPYQWASSEDEIDTPRGTCISPAPTASRNCWRVNHRAASISAPSTSISPRLRVGDETQHQAGRQRPRLVAEVGHLPDGEADLLADLASYGVLEGLARLAEAGERGPPVRGPARLPPQQDLLAVDDGHDHGGVAARELRPVAAGAPQLVAGRARLERTGAARAEPGRVVPLGQPDRVEEQRGEVGAAGEHGQQRAQRHPLLLVARRLGRGDQHREARRTALLAEQDPGAAGRLLRRQPRHLAVDDAQPGAGHHDDPGGRVGPPAGEPRLVGALVAQPVVGVPRERDVREQVVGRHADDTTQRRARFRA